MVEQPAPAQPSPTQLYALFAGFIDQGAVLRFHNAIALATQADVSHVHLLMQTNGGNIGEGISLYNLFHAVPFELTVYNVGSVCSIGVIAFLGAKNRRTSKFGTFMIHRAYSSPIGTSEKLGAAASQMEMDDKRIEEILKTHAKIPADKWELHKFADVWLSAEDAVAYDIAKIGEFAPPVGQKLFSIWPPQN